MGSKNKNFTIRTDKIQRERRTSQFLDFVVNEYVEPSEETPSDVDLSKKAEIAETVFGMFDRLEEEQYLKSLTSSKDDINNSNA